MYKVIVSANNIGKAAKQLERKLNEGSESQYAVAPTKQRGSGAVRVTNLDSNKYTDVYLQYDEVERSAKEPIAWDSSYRIDVNGEVFDKTGEAIGKVRIIPNKSNATKLDRSYKTEGKYNANQINMVDLVSDEDIQSLIDFLD